MARRKMALRFSILIGLSLLVVLVVASLVWIGGEARRGPPSPAEHDRASEENVRQLLHDGCYEEAVAEARELLSACEAAEDGSLRVADALDLLVRSLWRFGKGGEPETHALAQRSLRIREEQLGPDAALVAKSLKNVGMLIAETDDPSKAQPILERALSIVEARLHPHDPLKAAVLADLGYLALYTSEYEIAAAHLEEALTVHQHATTADPIEESTVLNALALIDFQFRGDYGSARKRYECILEIRTEHLPPAHPLLAGTYNNLGLVLMRIGDLAAARDMFENAIAIRKKIDPNHPLLATSLNNLAIIQEQEGNLDAAQHAYERAREILVQTQGDRHSRVATLTHNLGWVHYLKSDFPAALAYYNKAWAIYASTVGFKSMSAVSLLQDMATLGHAMGDVDSVASKYQRCVEIQEEILGPEHPELAATYSQYATGLANVGEPEAALRAALHAEALSREHLRLTARSLAEREALLYSGVRVKGLELALHLAAENAVAEDNVPDVWHSLIRSRALVLDEMATRSRRAPELNAPHITQLTNELAEARNKLAQLSVRGPEGEAPEEYRRQFEAARLEKEDAERRLAEESVEFRDRLARAHIGFTDVRKSLASDAALVAFAVYDLPWQPSDSQGNENQTGSAMGSSVRLDPSSRLVAFVLRPGVQPRLVSLGSMKVVGLLVASWNREAANGTLLADRTPQQADEAYRECGAALRAAIWDPLLPALADAERVFIVPDGVVHQVNFAALPVSAERYVIDTGRVLHYLSSERDLVPAEEHETIGIGLLALGGADFDAAEVFNVSNTEPHEAEQAVHSGDPLYWSPLYAGSLEPCAEFSSLRFSPLPGTAFEVQRIDSLWEQSKGKSNHEDASEVSRVRSREDPHVVLLTGAAATEGRFKLEAAGKRVLHVATHGFFLGGECSSGASSTRGLGSGTRRPTESPPPVQPLLNPLLLAGLVMAGANERAMAQPGQEDGILTGEEIASLDLHGVEWAVLSACDTGAGELQTGEGVLGLRRAFQVAGVRSLIMSLWAVSDEATREWMEVLYEARLRDGLGTADSVHHASVEILKRRRAANASTHPFYWASFVSAGDWL